MKQEKRFTFDTIQMPTVCSAFLFIARTAPSFFNEGVFS